MNLLSTDQVNALATEHANAEPDRQAQISQQLFEDRAARQQADYQTGIENAQKMFTDPQSLNGQWTPEQSKAAQVMGVDEQKAKTRFANISYISAVSGKSRDAVNATYEPLRDSISSQYFGKPTVTDEGFFNTVKGNIEAVQNQKARLNEIAGEGANAALTQAIDGKPADWAASFNAMNAQAKPGSPVFSNGEDWQTFRDAFQKSYDLGTKNRDLFDIAKSVLSEDVGTNKGPTPSTTLDQAAQRIAALSPDERQSVYGLLSIYAQRNGAKSPTELLDRLGKFSENVGKSAERGASGLANGAILDDLQLLAIQRNLENGTDAIVGKKATLDNLQSLQEQSQTVGSFGTGMPAAFRQSQPSREITPDEKKGLLAQVQQKLQTNQVLRELRNFSETNLDPVKAVLGGGKVGNAFERGMYGLAGSAPLMAEAAIPYVGIPLAAASMTGGAYESLRVKYPDLEPEKAAAVAGLTGVAQGAAFKLPLEAMAGRLPFASKAIAALMTPTSSFWARAAIGTAAHSIEQTAVMSGINLIPAASQSVISALDKDVPSVNWKQELGNAWNQLPETFFMALPMALVGAGVMASKESKFVSAVIKDADSLTSFGIKPEDAQNIAELSKTDPKAAEEQFRTAWQARTPEEIKAAADAMAERIKQAKQVQESPEAPTLRPTASGGFQILNSDGTVSSEHADEASALTAFHDKVQGEISGNHESQAMNDLKAFFEEKDPNRRVELVKSSRFLSDALDEKTATPEQVAERMRIAGAVEGESPASVRITGENVAEVKDNLFTDVSKLYQGSSVDTMIEERAHGDFKKALAEGTLTMEDGLAAVREWAKAHPEFEIRDDMTPAQQETAVHEGVADMVKAKFFGNLNKIEGIPASVKAFIARAVTYFREVFRRAGTLRKLSDEGKLSGNFEDFLAKSVGLHSEHEVAKVTHEAASDISGTAFSVKREGDESVLENARQFKSPEEFGDSLRSADSELQINNKTDEPYRGNFTEGEHLIDKYGENPYVYEARYIDPNQFRDVLKLEGMSYESVAKMPTTEKYAEWYREGHEPPPISVVTRDDGRLISTDRRRVVAALEAGVNKIPAFVEVGRRDDIWNKAQEQVSPNSQGETSFSAITAKDYVERISAKIDALKRNPEERLKIYERAKEKLDALKAVAEKKLYPFALEVMGKKEADRATMLHAFGTIDAVASALPPEVRAKIGGSAYANIAKLQSYAARSKFVESQIDKVDKALESTLKKEYTGRIESLIEKSKPIGGGGDKVKGKIGVEGHRAFKEIERVSTLSADEVEKSLEDVYKEFDKTDPADTKAILSLTEKAHYLEAFGNIEGKTSDELSNSLKLADEIYTKGRTSWIAQEESRLQELGSLRHSIIDGQGKTGTDSQLIESKENDKGAKGFAKGLANRFRSFSQVMEIVLGRDNPVTARWHKADVKASAQKEKAIIETHGDFQKLLRDIYGKETGALQRGRELWKLRTERSINAEKIDGRVVESVKIPIDTARDILDGKLEPESFGIKEEDRDTLKEAVDAWSTSKSRAESVEIETEKNPGTKETVPLTAMEAVYLTQLAKQSRYEKAMERNGWTPEVMASIEKQLPNDAKAIRSWMADRYAEGYKPLNEIFQKQHGIDLPREESYAPARFKHDSIEVTPDVYGAGTAFEGGMNTGFLRTRKNHSARPELADALTNFFQHVAATEHYKAYAEFSREMNGVLRSQKVQASIEAAQGKRSLSPLTDWVQAIGEGGAKAKSYGRELDEIARRLSGSSAYLGLAWNLGTASKHLLSAFNSAAQMPLTEYAKGFAKLLSGNLEVSHIWNADFMQIRVHGDWSPEQKAAMAKSWETAPSRRQLFLDLGTHILPYVDTVANTGGAAIFYDYQYREAMKMGMELEQAHTTAMDATEDMVYRTAYPATMTTRSLAEIGASSMGKLLWLFATPGRQKMGMFLTAVEHAFKGEGEHNKADLIRTMFVTHVIGGLVAHGIGAAWRSAHDDQESDFFNEKDWQPKDFLIAALAGPIAEMPLIRDAIAYFEGKPTHNAAGTMATGAHSIWQVLEAQTGNLSKGQEAYKDRDPWRWYMNKAADAMSLVGYGLGNGFESLGVAARLLNDRRKEVEKLASDDKKKR